MSLGFLLVLLLGAAAIFVYKKTYKKKVAPVKTTADFKMGTDYGFGPRFPPEWNALAAKANTVSAKNGNVDSYMALGYMHERGVHFKQDYEEAVKWYRLAADAGHATATLALSTCYMEGYGVPRDENESMRLLAKAANLGEPTAQSYLGSAYEVGFKSISEDKRESLNWYMKAAQKGNALAQMKVGDAYMEGDLLHRDEGKAIEYLGKAAEQNRIEAIRRLGLIYDRGMLGIEPNELLAFEWYMKGALLGDAECEYSVAFDYLQGKGVANDDKQAAEWFIKASDKGLAKAASAIGAMFLGGRYFEGDVAVAKSWLNKAALQGDEFAVTKLRELDGVGT